MSLNLFYHYIEQFIGLYVTQEPKTVKWVLELHKIKGFSLR